MTKPLKGKHILINAGPTHEPIDPVRFIGNSSTGKMGIELADASAELGASVDLVLGAVDILPENKAIKVISATTAESMASECISLFPKCNIAILTAAVADYTPVEKTAAKIKKDDKNINLELKPTVDIAKSLGELKKAGQLLVGFALETNNEIENAKNKLKRKNLDIIVLNSLKDKGAGFGYDTNKVTLIDKNNNIDKFELKTKKEVARDILNKIISMLK